jgi:hypothetical protein
MLGVVRMSTIWQRLGDEYGLECSVASFRRYVRANLPEDVRRAEVVVLREEPAGPLERRDHSPGSRRDEGEPPDPPGEVRGVQHP